MTILFRPESARGHGGNSAGPPPPPPPPSPSVWEEETDEEDIEEFEASEYSPISTPFLSPGFNKRKERESGGWQLPILEIVIATLRKSLLVSCSVEREDVSANAMEISYPTNVRHISHVTFDRFSGFLGLPLEFQPELPPRVPSASVSVFGVSPGSMQCRTDKRGNSVPTILLKLQERFVYTRRPSSRRNISNKCGK